MSHLRLVKRSDVSKPNKHYPDHTFKKGDRVCEYVPYPNQEDGPWDDGPRKRYMKRIGIFLGNERKSDTYNSWVLVDGQEVLICRSDLCYKS